MKHQLPGLQKHTCACMGVHTHTHTHTHVHTLVLTKKQPLLGPAPPKYIPHSHPRPNPALTSSCSHTPRPLLTLTGICELFCPRGPPVVGGYEQPPTDSWLAVGGRVLRTPGFLRSESVSAEARAPSRTVLRGLHPPLRAPPLLPALTACPPSFPSPFPPLSSHLSPQNPLSQLSLCRQGN